MLIFGEEEYKLLNRSYFFVLSGRAILEVTLLWQR